MDHVSKLAFSGQNGRKIDNAKNPVRPIKFSSFFSAKQTTYVRKAHGAHII